MPERYVDMEWKTTKTATPGLKVKVPACVLFQNQETLGVFLPKTWLCSRPCSNPFGHLSLNKASNQTLRSLSKGNFVGQSALQQYANTVVT